MEPTWIIVSHLTNITYFTVMYYDAVPFTFYGSDCLTPLIIVTLIPVYLFLLRPFIYDYYIPGMLKRMGTEISLLLVSGSHC
jgi:hypothetical protein